jgi:HEAT repeat protein
MGKGVVGKSMNATGKATARITAVGATLVLGIAAIGGTIGCGGSNGTAPSSTDGANAANSSTGSSEKSKNATAGAGNSTAKSGAQPNSSTKSGNGGKSSTGPSPALAEASKWIAGLADRDPVRRDEARAKIDSLGEGKIDLLLAALKTGTPTERQGAAFYLMGELHADDATLVAAFTDALGDENSTVRHIALQAITSLPDDRLAPIVPQLVIMVENTGEQPTTRAEAARLIARLGSAASEAVPALEQIATSGDDPRVRGACAYAISRIAPADEAIALLRRLQNDNDATVRRLAVARLASIGSDSEAALSGLAAALGDDDEQVRKMASDALVRNGRSSVPALIAALDSENPIARRNAVYTLGLLGELAKPAIPALRRRLTDSDEETRKLAEAVLDRWETAPQ